MNPYGTNKMKNHFHKNIFTAPCEVAQEAESYIDGDDKKSEAAGKIMSLLSEIGSNEMLASVEHFQPWFWEPSHGKLMTV